MSLLFTKNDPHITDVKCKYCGSNIMETINDEHPHGMSALNDGYDFMCANCGKLVKAQ
jgi:DNA-directed RNA polymerase subunit RPC12/RpoP